MNKDLGNTRNQLNDIMNKINGIHSINNIQEIFKQDISGNNLGNYLTQYNNLDHFLKETLNNLESSIKINNNGQLYDISKRDNTLFNLQIQKLNNFVNKIEEVMNLKNSKDTIVKFNTTQLNPEQIKTDLGLYKENIIVKITEFDKINNELIKRLNTMNKISSRQYETNQIKVIDSNISMIDYVKEKQKLKQIIDKFNYDILIHMQDLEQLVKFNDLSYKNEINKIIEVIKTINKQAQTIVEFDKIMNEPYKKAQKHDTLQDAVISLNRIFRKADIINNVMTAEQLYNVKVDMKKIDYGQQDMVKKKMAIISDYHRELQYEANRKKLEDIRLLYSTYFVPYANLLKKYNITIVLDYDKNINTIKKITEDKMTSLKQQKIANLDILAKNKPEFPNNKIRENPQTILNKITEIADKLKRDIDGFNKLTNKTIQNNLEAIKQFGGADNSEMFKTLERSMNTYSNNSNNLYQELLIFSQLIDKFKRTITSLINNTELFLIESQKIIIYYAYRYSVLKHIIIDKNTQFIDPYININDIDNYKNKLLILQKQSNIHQILVSRMHNLLLLIENMLKQKDNLYIDLYNIEDKYAFIDLLIMQYISINL
jgi:hypothetical protein